MSNKTPLSVGCNAYYRASEPVKITHLFNIFAIGINEHGDTKEGCFSDFIHENDWNAYLDEQEAQKTWRMIEFAMIGAWNFRCPEKGIKEFPPGLTKQKAAALRTLLSEIMEIKEPSLSQ